MDTKMRRTVMLVAAAVAAIGAAQVVAADQNQPSAASALPANQAGAKVCRLGAIGVDYDDYRWYVDLGYDFIARIAGVPQGAEKEIQEVLQSHGVEYWNYGQGDIKITGMGLENVPPERRGLKRGPGANKYTNSDAVCGGWDEQYRYCGEKTAKKIKDWAESGIIFEDYLNRALCYCKACEADYRRDIGQPGFPQLVYQTPHYEDTVAFDPVLIAWDQERTARHFRIMAEPIHKVGKKVAVAGVCRWIIGPEAAAAVDKVMFYTYYAGRRLPANFMRNWKYWHDHVVPQELWVIFGYFREYHTCHTRVMLANLPDGVNLTFWACGRQQSDPETREDALYAADVVRSRLVPIRVAVYDSQATQAYRQKEQRSWRQDHVEKAIVGLERLGLDAEAVSSLDSLDRFELLYLEDVECLSRAEVDRIRDAGIPVLAAGLTGLRDEAGRPWGELDAGLPRVEKSDKVLNLPVPVALGDGRVNVELEALRPAYPWFEVMFDAVSKRRGGQRMARPYTDPSFYHGIKQYALSLIPGRVYGEFIGNAVISHCDGTPLAFSSETGRPMIVYNALAQQVYSTVKFSDYVNVNDLTECGFGYQMRQFCFLQIIDALTLPRRGVRVEPYLMTAVRATDTGHFLTIGNVYDEPRTVTVTLAREPKAVRVNHVLYDKWQGHEISLPPIGAKDAIQVHVDY